MEVNVILTSRYERVVLMDCKEDTWLSLKSTVGNVMVPQVNSVQLKNDKIGLIFLLNKKIRNHFNFFTCILPDYMAYDSPKIFLKKQPF